MIGVQPRGRERLRADANGADHIFCRRRLSCARTLLTAVFVMLVGCGSASTQRDQNAGAGVMRPPTGKLAERDGPAIQKRRTGITSRNDFEIEAEAERHCNGRSVVWVIARNRTYFSRQNPRYGTKAGGAYMCEDEAKGDGNHSALH